MDNNTWHILLPLIKARNMDKFVKKYEESYDNINGEAYLFTNNTSHLLVKIAINITPTSLSRSIKGTLERYIGRGIDYVVIIKGTMLCDNDNTEHIMGDYCHNIFYEEELLYLPLYDVRLADERDISLGMGNTYLPVLYTDDLLCRLYDLKQGSIVIIRTPNLDDGVPRLVMQR